MLAQFKKRIINFVFYFLGHFAVYFHSVVHAYVLFELSQEDLL